MVEHLSFSFFKAGTPYSRSVQQANPLPKNQLPDPGLVFDTFVSYLCLDVFVSNSALTRLLKREGVRLLFLSNSFTLNLLLVCQASRRTFRPHVCVRCTRHSQRFPDFPSRRQY
jgi:hypothetical protein